MKPTLSSSPQHEEFFRLALRSANRALRSDEVPIGAVLVKNGSVIAAFSNQTEKRRNFTAHAEMLCLNRATKKLGTKFLNDCDLYVTLEPCMMCRFAARLSRIRRIHYLARSQQFGRRGKAYFKTKVIRLNARGLLTQRSEEILKTFFKSKRSKKG